MEGILVLLIPVLALATGFVAVLRMPPEALAGKRNRDHGELPAADTSGLQNEVALMREELAQMRERLDFTERLLMDGSPAQRLAAPPQPLARPADA
jgi:hypothetical protein